MIYFSTIPVVAYLWLITGMKWTHALMTLLTVFVVIWATQRMIRDSNQNAGKDTDKEQP